MIETWNPCLVMASTRCLSSPIDSSLLLNNLLKLIVHFEVFNFVSLEQKNDNYSQVKAALIVRGLGIRGFMVEKVGKKHKYKGKYRKNKPPKTWVLVCLGPDSSGMQPPCE